MRGILQTIPILFIVWLTAGAAFADAAADTVVWARYHFPPVMIENGPLAKQGFVDKMIAHVMAARRDLPQTEANLVNVLRVETLARARENICSATLFKSREHEEILYFSSPSLIVATNRLIVPVAHFTALTNQLRNGAIELSALTKFDRWRVAVGLGRHFTANIDRHLDGLPPARLARVTPNWQAIAMLAAGRIDYTFGYPFEIAYAEKESGSQGEFRTIPVIGDPQFQIVHFSCAKTPAGARMIAAIDEILDADPMPFSVPFVLEWLAPTERDDYMANIVPHLLARRAGGN